MIHPHTELRFISKEIGYGVVATQFIPKGTITWVYDLLDRSFSPEQLSTFSEAYKQILDTYCYRDSRGGYILCWDNARYVNHSFHSNCITTAYNFELAVRDIHAGEELTDDYGYLNCTNPFNALPEHGSSRTRVLPDDLLHYYQEWDEQLLVAFRHFTDVAQPLEPFVDMRWRKKAGNIAKGSDEMDSILNCFYSDNPELMKLKQKLLKSYHTRTVMEEVVA